MHGHSCNIAGTRKVGLIRHEERHFVNRGWHSVDGSVGVMIAVVGCAGDIDQVLRTRGGSAEEIYVLLK